MAIFLLTFAVCLLICGFMVTALMLSRTPRYRTSADDLLTLLDETLDNRVSEARWHTIIGYPIRHDPYLENVRRRCQAIMDEYGQPWRFEQGGSLLSSTGLEEIRALRQHLTARLSLGDRRAF
ncbi:hypothetical protein SAMN05421848_0534 [Kushneria avicenniae]|uniref:Uncharacterized protein n=1 Tax=Kushneria avicenniae TaxID=402385 RepID=A0A1I1GE29_9GAMM|nr:hypothetical protein [Kushneria avicenniae]SFC09831.1 hypothetical protein SAMN05421848_0534 [Kushneria avicenniae]